MDAGRRPEGNVSMFRSRLVGTHARSAGQEACRRLVDGAESESLSRAGRGRLGGVKGGVQRSPGWGRGGAAAIAVRKRLAERKRGAGCKMRSPQRSDRCSTACSKYCMAARGCRVITDTPTHAEGLLKTSARVEPGECGRWTMRSSWRLAGARNYGPRFFVADL